MRKSDNGYRRLADFLREKIINGEWAAWERLPTERDLSREFGVTRVTVRNALQVLENERLIRRIQGSGTYVAPSRTRLIPLRIDYSGSMRVYMPKLKRRLMYCKRMLPSEIVRSELNIKTDSEILYAERVDRNDDIAIAFDKVYIPWRLALKLTTVELEKVDFIETWSAASNFEVSECRQYIEAEASDKLCRKYLNLGIGSPVLKSTEFYYMANGSVAGLFVSYYHPEYICINSNYNWKCLPLRQHQG